jgi:hypothetical protein
MIIDTEMNIILHWCLCPNRARPHIDDIIKWDASDTYYLPWVCGHVLDSQGSWLFRNPRFRKDLTDTLRVNINKIPYSLPV